MIVDYQGRAFSALRVSITKACNLSCTYCVPIGGSLSNTKELSADEFFKAIKLLYEVLELKKIRLTGGEPLVSSKLPKLLPLLGSLPINDFTLTTNGQLLKEKIGILKENRVNRINVSLDTLSHEKFKEITRGGNLQKTLDGIDRALDAGLKIKVNMIPMKGLNEEEIVPLLDYCLERGIELRYIELMRMGHLADRDNFMEKFISLDYLLSEIKKHYPVVSRDSGKSATAKGFQIPETGHFGVIANDSAPFCTSCNRLRLTSEGDLYGCLSSTMKFPLKDLLKINEEDAKKELRNVLSKALATKQDFAFYGSNVPMKSVGG